jgi:hypothetical protein
MGAHDGITFVKQSRAESSLHRLLRRPAVLVCGESEVAAGGK